MGAEKAIRFRSQNPVQAGNEGIAKEISPYQNLRRFCDPAESYLRPPPASLFPFIITTLERDLDLRTRVSLIGCSVGLFLKLLLIAWY